MALDPGGGFLGDTVRHLTATRKNLSPYLVASDSSMLLVADMLCSVYLFFRPYNLELWHVCHISSGVICEAGSVLSPEVFELMIQFFRADT